jgi:hypothetical protein
LRVKFGELSSVFSSNSYGYTLAGTMTPGSGLAGAYPLVRIDPLADNPKWQFSNYHIAGLRKPEVMLDIHEDAAVAAGSYVPHDQKTTWRDPHRAGPWRVQQAWLYLPDRLIGLMVLRATGETEARSAEHIYRLMTGEVSPAEEGSYEAGDLRLTVGPTNLKHIVVEPGRKYAMSPREPWRQVVLSDRQRPTREQAREHEEEDSSLPMKTYEAGRSFHSIVEIRRSEAESAGMALVALENDLLAFSAQIGENRYLTVANYAVGGDSRPIKWRDRDLPIDPQSVQLIRHAPRQ